MWSKYWKLFDRNMDDREETRNLGHKLLTWMRAIAVTCFLGSLRRITWFQMTSRMKGQRHLGSWFWAYWNNVAIRKGQTESGQGNEKSEVTFRSVKVSMAIQQRTEAQNYIWERKHLFLGVSTDGEWNSMRWSQWQHVLLVSVLWNFSC